MTAPRVARPRRGEPALPKKVRRRIDPKAPRGLSPEPASEERLHARRAREVFEVEGCALAEVASRIDETFGRAVELLRETTERGGKILITGVGKSGLVGKKIAATLNSTGASSLFLHPVEAVHGDLGMVRAGDVSLVISKTGRSEEIAAILPTLKRLGVPIIALTGSSRSQLASWADVVLDVGVPEEACGYDMIPTSSTTAALVMGDALALALFDARGLRPEDFAQNHPGGVLGRRLLLRVREIMHRPPDLPLVTETTTVEAALLEILDKRLGVTVVANEEGLLRGILTDGDLKRILLSRRDILGLPVSQVMTRTPKTIDGEELVARALKKMEERPNKRITCLVIVDKEGRPEGLIHLYDCLKAGIS